VNGFYTLHLDAPIQPGKAGKVSLGIVDGRGIARKDVAFPYSKLLPSQPNSDYGLRLFVCRFRLGGLVRTRFV
jgi:hypothetical protein